MKIYKISLVGYVVGLLIVIFSYFHWVIYFKDLSQFIFGFGSGTVIIVFSYIYSVLKNNDEEHQEIFKMIDVLLDWKNKLELRKK